MKYMWLTLALIFAASTPVHIQAVLLGQYKFLGFLFSSIYLSMTCWSFAHYRQLWWAEASDAEKEGYKKATRELMGILLGTLGDIMDRLHITLHHIKTTCKKIHRCDNRTDINSCT